MDQWGKELFFWVATTSCYGLRAFSGTFANITTRRLRTHHGSVAVGPKLGIVRRHLIDQLPT